MDERIKLIVDTQLRKNSFICKVDSTKGNAKELHKQGWVDCYN